MARLAHRCGKVVWILIGEILAAWPVWAGPEQEAAPGRRIMVRAAGHEEQDASFAVNLVRSEGVSSGLPGCLLEVVLPVGVGVRELPRVIQGAAEISVRLFIGPGPGGVYRYALDECPPEGLPLRLSMGAGM
jgi:hypothetical protein